MKNVDFSKEKVNLILKKMKVKIIILLFISCCFISCYEKPEILNEYNRLLSGKHELRKFNVRNTSRTESRGCWFFVVGSYSSTTIEDSKIRFYFKTVDNEYVFKEMDFNKVNIKIDSTAETPYVKFYWNDCGSMYHGNRIYEYAITRVVVYCKEEDFQPEININDLR